MSMVRRYSGPILRRFSIRIFTSRLLSLVAGLCPCGSRYILVTVAFPLSWMFLKLSLLMRAVPRCKLVRKAVAELDLIPAASSFTSMKKRDVEREPFRMGLFWPFDGRTAPIAPRPSPPIAFVSRSSSSTIRPVRWSTCSNCMFSFTKCKMRGGS